MMCALINRVFLCVGEMVLELFRVLFIKSIVDTNSPPFFYLHYNLKFSYWSVLKMQTDHQRRNLFLPFYLKSLLGV